MVMSHSCYYIQIFGLLSNCHSSPTPLPLYLFGPTSHFFRTLNRLLSIEILLKIVFQDVDTACIKLYCRDNPTKLVDFLSSPASYSCDYEDCLSVLKEFQRFGISNGCGVSSLRFFFFEKYFIYQRFLNWST